MNPRWFFRPLIYLVLIQTFYVVGLKNKNQTRKVMISKLVHSFLVIVDYTVDKTEIHFCLVEQPLIN